MGDGAAIVGAALAQSGPTSEKRKSLRDLLALYAEARATVKAERDALLVSRGATDDEHMLMLYVLSLPEEEAGGLYSLLNTLEGRAAAAKPEPAELTRPDFLALHAAFNKAPAQLHTPILGFLDAHRASAALALCLAPASIAESVFPTLAPILLMPAPARAAALATSLLHDATRSAPLLAAFQQLSLSTQAAVASELPPSAMALAVVAATKSFTDASKLGSMWETMEALAQSKAPTAEQLEALHTTLNSMSPMAVSRVARCIGDMGNLIEAAPHLPLDRWQTLVGSMRQVNGRVVVSNARVSAALVRHESVRVGRVYYNNPEQRSMIGFLCGWLLLLVSFLGAIEQIINRDLLHLMLDLYILACSLLTVLLELEINSRLIRDHAALPIEHSLSFLRLASGRGVLYCAVGLLAIDISQQERLEQFAGGAMLLFGALNLVLGSVVALKLKKLRRSLTGPAALSTAYHNALAEGPVGDQGLDGLNAAGARRMFKALGVHFNKLQLQAVFLEIDGDRRGLLTEAQLLNWYHGHIGRQLKKLANAKPPPGEARTVRKWLCSWPDSAFDLSIYAAAMNLVLIPTSLFAMLLSISDQSLLQLVLNLYICVIAILMLVIETRAEPTRRTSLHLLRYASVMMHPTARGVLYLLVSLTLLSQQAPLLWTMGYVVEAIGMLHVIAGSQVASKLSALRRQFGDNRSIVSAFRAVSPDNQPISTFGVKLIAQSVGVKLRWRFEQHAVRAILDLDRDGKVVEADLLYWLGTEEEEEDHAADPPQDSEEMPAAMENGSAGVAVATGAATAVGVASATNSGKDQTIVTATIAAPELANASSTALPADEEEDEIVD